jgi:hypothetical protein
VRRFRLPLAAFGLAALLGSWLTAQTPAPLPNPPKNPAAAYLNPADYGVVGNGVKDDTAAWQNCINACPDNGCILVPPSMCSVITSPLKIYSRSGLTIRSLGQPDTKPLGTRGAEFVCQFAPATPAVPASGTTPAVPAVPQRAAIDLNWAHCCVLEGLSISCDSKVGTPPASAVSIDQYADASQPKNTITSTTRNAIRRCLFTAPPAAGTFNGIQVAVTSKTNCDFTTVEDSRILGTVAGWGNGVYIGPASDGTGVHSNAKQNRIVFCGVNNATNGYYLANGSGRILDCSATNNACDVRVDTVNDYFVVDGMNSEQAGQCFYVGGANCPYSFRNCRWAAVRGPYAVYNRSAWLTLDSVSIAGVKGSDGKPAVGVFDPAGLTTRLHLHAFLPRGLQPMAQNGGTYGCTISTGMTTIEQGF